MRTPIKKFYAFIVDNHVGSYFFEFLIYSGLPRLQVCHHHLLKGGKLK